MRFGLFGINFGPCARPETIARVARAAEAAGFDSVWTGEHVVLPAPQAPPSPAPPEMPFLDPAVALGFVAAHTERVGLGTGIVILPQRNPLVLAKQLVSVDVLSQGRLLFGLGAGYLHQEFAALGIPFDDRGARTDEYIEVIRTLWTEATPRFEGRFHRFGGIDAQPRPVQRPHPPFVIGGQSAPAYRRAQRVGSAWYGFALDHATTERCIEGLAAAARDVERPAALGTLGISVTPPPGLDLESARRYADLGVDRLILLPTARSEDELVRFVETAGDTLVAKLA